MQCTGPSSEAARTYWFETSQKIFGSIFSTVARKKMHGTVLRTVFQKSFKSNYAPSTPAAKPSLLTGTGFLFLCVFFSFWFNFSFFFQKLSPSHLFSGNVHRHCNTTRTGARTKPTMHSPQNKSLKRGGFEEEHNIRLYFQRYDSLKSLHFQQTTAKRYPVCI